MNTKHKKADYNAKNPPPHITWSHTGGVNICLHLSHTPLFQKCLPLIFTSIFRSLEGFWFWLLLRRALPIPPPQGLFLLVANQPHFSDSCLSEQEKTLSSETNVAACTGSERAAASSASITHAFVQNSPFIFFCEPKAPAFINQSFFLRNSMFLSECRGKGWEGWLGHITKLSLMNIRLLLCGSSIYTLKCVAVQSERAQLFCPEYHSKFEDKIIYFINIEANEGVTARQRNWCRWIQKK